MLLQESPSLEELVLQTLAYRPGASAVELESIIRARGAVYSLRGIYKELNKLIAQGIVFKRGTTYNIHLTWIMKLLAFGDTAFEHYTNNPYLVEVLQEGSLKKVERFNDLSKLDRLWTQLILALHTIYPRHVMCIWCPYQWFYLAQYYAAKQFYEAIDLAGYKRFHIIGSDNYLNRQALNDLPKNGVYSFAPSPFQRENSTYYTVISDCVISVKLDRLITEKLEALFDSVKAEKDIQAQKLAEVFSSRVRATLTCERNEIKATRLKKKFANYFGVEIS